MQVCFRVLRAIEANRLYVNTMPCCELQLGKRGLYPTLGARTTQTNQVKCLMWLCNMCDGEMDLLALAERSGLDIFELESAAKLLMDQGVFKLKA